jgi:hypothetical protein
MRARCRAMMPLCTVLSIALISPPDALASSARAPDLCAPPTKLDTAKWRAMKGPEGMEYRLPPGYVISGSSAIHTYYINGHKGIGAALGDGPSVLSQGYRVSQRSGCTTVIGGRPVQIAVLELFVEDAPLSASGEAGSHYAIVARWTPVAGLSEVSLWFVSQIRSDLTTMRQLFWTASFPALAKQTAAAESAKPDLAAACATPAAPAPPIDGVLDTALVQMLANNSGPIPAGYAVLELRFDETGAPAGVTVAESTLPDAAQRQLATLVTSNLKPHDAKASPTLRLRVETGASFTYRVLAEGCSS